MVSPQIHQHSNGTISIRVGDKIYSDTEQNFKKDFGAKLPQLPLGVDERVYEQGVRHALSSENSVVDGGPMPWASGDTVLGNLNDALDKQQQRLDKEVKRLKKQADDDTEEHQKKIKEDVAKLHAGIEEKEKAQREVIDKKNAKELDDKLKEGKRKNEERETERAKLSADRAEKARLKHPPPQEYPPLQPLPFGATPDERFASWREGTKSPPDDKPNQG